MSARCHRPFFSHFCFFLIRNDGWGEGGGGAASGGSDPVKVDDATHVTAQ